MTVKLKPLDDRVIVELAKREEATAAGVFLPEVARVKPQRGLVIAVGPGRLLENGERVPIGVGAWNEVVFASHAGTEIKLGDRKLLILKEDDVLAVVQETATG